MTCFRVQSLLSSLHGSLKWAESNPTKAQSFEVIYCHPAIMFITQFIQKQALCHGMFYASICMLWFLFFFIYSICSLSCAYGSKEFSGSLNVLWIRFLYFLIFMICATPSIVSFDKYFKQHQGIILLWFICQQATRESFSRPLWRLWCLGQNLLPCSCGRSKSNPSSYQVMITISSHWPNVTTFGDLISQVYLTIYLSLCSVFGHVLHCSNPTPIPTI